MEKCCHDRASEAVSARIGSMWKKFRELRESCVSWKARFIFKTMGRFINVVFKQFCCTIVKHGDLMLWIRC